MKNNYCVIKISYLDRGWFGCKKSCGKFLMESKEEAGEIVLPFIEIKELEEGNDSQPSLPSVTYRDLEACEGEGAFPIEKLKESLQALDDRIMLQSGNLHSSVDAFPMFSGGEGGFDEEFDEYYSDPIINFGSNHEDTTTTGTCFEF